MPVKNNKAFSLSENTEGSSDPIRNTIQSFWIYDGSELTYDTRNSYNSTTKEAKTSLLLFDFQDNLNTEDNSIKLDSDTTLTLKTYKERIDITPVYLSEGGVIGALSGRSSSGRIEADPENNFDSYIEDQIIPSLGVSRIEYKLDLGSPVEYASAVDNNSVIAGTVNFVYNYGFELYEDAIQEGSISESSLPNFYKIFPISNERPITKQRVIKRINGPFLNDFSRTDKVGFLSIQDFFMNSDGFIDALDVQTRKDAFPFYNEVYFTNPADTLENDKFRESLRDSGLIIAFCDLMNREDFRLSQDQEVPVVDGLSFANSYLSSSYEDATQTSFKEQPALKTETVRLYDIPEMLKIMHAAVIPKKSSNSVGSASGRTPVNQVDTTALQVDTTTLRDKGFLTDGEQAEYRLDTISKIKANTNPTIDYQNALDDLVSTINELTANLDNFKNYKEILEGKDKTYQSDVLFYRIKKYEEGSDTPIQNFWIPAEKGYRGIRYIDTQVKYGKMYRYEICAFKFVMGSEYEFVEKDSGVINFGEDLSDLISQKDEDLKSLSAASLIKPAVEKAASELGAILPSSLGFSSLDVDKTSAGLLAEFLESNNLIDSGFTDIENYTRIFIFAESVISSGVGEYIGKVNRISKENLTPEELQKLEIIRQTWGCLTNTNSTDPQKLAELEIVTNRVIALSGIKKAIVDALEKEARIQSLALSTAPKDLLDEFKKQASEISNVFSDLFDSQDIQSGSISKLNNLLSANDYTNYNDVSLEDLNEKKLKDLYGEIAKLTSSTRAPLTTSTGNYSISLANPVTFDYDDDFTLTENRLRLEISSTFDDKADGERQKAFLTRKRGELKDAEKRFEAESLKLLSLVDEYLGCYQDFIEAASDFNVVLDYKRINKYSLIIKTKPTIKLAELPYYRSEGMILDNPPIYPNVNVVTYRGIADKLSFFMNSGQGEIEVSPITFSDKEEIFLSNYRKSRKLNDFQPILYKSDETENLGTVFEIRRLSSPPENYDSFRGARVVNTSRAIRTGNLPAATYDDEIMSNRKYYYIFRVADRRGTISYPTGVMEIEIVENSGIIYPVIKPYEFPKQKTDTTKNLKRLLNVVPRITQVLPPRDRDTYKSLTAGSTNILGREEEGLFGKQFKLRLTSKKTGKTVDLNLNFKTTVVETAEAE